MRVQPFSIDPRGTWSPRQAKAVLDVIGPEAEQRGLGFEMLDVTTFQMPAPRVMLQAYCLEHEWPVLLDEACEMCLRGLKGTAQERRYTPVRFSA
jgi:hypothetical protein